MCVDGGLGWPGLLQIRVGCGGNRFLFCGFIYIYRLSNGFNSMFQFFMWAHRFICYAPLVRLCT